MEHPKYRETLVSDLGDEYLQHAGVKGMKWGVHRSRSAKYKHGKLGSKRAKKRYDKREERIKKLDKADKRASGIRAENRAKVDAVVKAARNNKNLTDEERDAIYRHITKQSVKAETTIQEVLKANQKKKDNLRAKNAREIEKGLVVPKDKAPEKKPEQKTPATESVSEKKPEQKTPAKKSVSEMTTQEMQDVINRHNVEAQYRKITEVPKKETTGQKATRYIAKKALKAGDAAVDRIMKDSVNSLISSAQKKLLEDQKKKKNG